MQSGAERLSRRYGEIRCPVKLLAGGSDRIVNSQRQTERLARHISHADLRIIDGVGHMLPHIDPDAVLGAVKRLEVASQASAASIGTDVQASRSEERRTQNAEKT